MTPERYLELIEQDGRRLAAAAAAGDLDAAIPTCPGWDVRECVTHTGQVYRHKVACIRLQRRPVEADGVEQEPPPGVELLDWFEASLDALLAELRERGPAAPAYTWWPADQTVGFWFRRMAQETAVHRLDVEDGRGTPTPVDPDLAVDGVDEVLDLFLGTWGGNPDDWEGVDPHAGKDGTVAVRTGGQAWRSTLGPDAIPLTRGDGAADAAVTGEPEAVLLWLWGRRPDEVVTLDGDPALLAAYRDRLRIATQ
jgi:uncharacterized protein (TIGR03083 family)